MPKRSPPAASLSLTLSRRNPRRARLSPSGLVAAMKPAYGARPLKRAIQKSVQDPLVELILSGQVKDGERVTISAGKQALAFNGQVAEEA